jgi:cytochrome oxidase Cu insertion factor (SCO1/SenC/PrrC family)
MVRRPRCGQKIRGILIVASTSAKDTVSIVAAVAMLAATSLPAGAQLPSYERVRALETPKQIGDAVFTDQNGAPFKLSDLRGKVAFVLFGFTNCPDVCPVSMERLRELHDSGLLGGEDVAYVMISVDGDRDTPAAMKAFLAKYSSDFIGLTAEPARVRPIAEQFSATFFQGSRHGHNGGYNVTHSPQIFVLDAAGRVRAEFYSASLEAMAGVTRALLDEEGAPRPSLRHAP